MADGNPDLRALLAGLAVGGLGAVWILRTHGNPPPALLYNVPLALAFGTYAWSLAFDVVPAVRRIRIVATVLSAALVLGRAAGDWPLSGHGVLGGALVFLAPRWWQRVLAAAVLVQSWVTKSASANDPMSVVRGALAGGALGLLALACERRVREA